MKKLILSLFLWMILPNSISWGQARQEASFQIHQITGSPFLKKILDETFENSKSNLICPLKASLDSPLDTFKGRGTDSQCQKKFGSTLPLIEPFAGRAGRHEIYLVYGGNFQFKSWTDHLLRTYLFVDNHQDRKDLLRSLVHELSIVYDVKYDATMWDFYFGSNLSLTPLLSEFFSTWMKSSVVRIGLAVGRSEIAENLIFEQAYQVPAGKDCYQALEEILLRQLSYGDIYMSTLDTHKSVSFKSALAQELERRGLVVTNQTIAQEELSAWLSRLSQLDPSGKFCEFLLKPVAGQSLNFMAAGPRPRVGGGAGWNSEGRESSTEEPGSTNEWIQSIKSETGNLQNLKDSQHWPELFRLRGL